MAIGLGDKVRDSVTGFEGIAIARTEWLHGCVRFTVQPPLDKDGKYPDSHTFDEPQLTVVEKRLVSVAAKETGGPRPEPTRAPDPQR